jgi:hypothetical protein
LESAHILLLCLLLSISDLIRIRRMPLFIFSITIFLILLINYFTRIINLVIFDAFALEIFGTAITWLVKVQLLFLCILSCLLIFNCFLWFFVSVWMFCFLLFLLFGSIIFLVYRVIHTRSLCCLSSWYRRTNSFSIFARNTIRNICVRSYWTRFGAGSCLLLLKFV